MYSKTDITTATWGEVKAMPRYDMAIIPWGATEPHNYHLPYCTDVLLSQAIAFEVAEKAQEKGIGAVVLPGVPFGSQNPGQGILPFCIHTTQATQTAILTDITESLRRQGIKKILIINGHGGNSFKGMIRDLAVKYPDVTICQSDWYAFIPRSVAFEESVDDHAGEQETSVMMHYYPSLVRMDLAGEGKAKSFSVEGLNRKVGWIPRDWSKVSEDTGVGNPLKSTPEKGKKYMESVIPALVDLVCDLVTKEDLY